jgi:16S rRNA (guanine966-N2)-methyltransferase
MARLRITGGLLHGRQLTLPDEAGVRHTSSKVRAALFDILGDVEGDSVLDLFAGSGIFAVEALSRGAAQATCVEKNREMVRRLLANVGNLGLAERCETLHMDVAKALPFLYKRGSAYDIIFLDPPYEKGLVLDAMLSLEQSPIFARGCHIVLEYSKREDVGTHVSGVFREVKTKEYGDTRVRIFVT